MGALKGSISVRRYTVLDPLPAEPRRRLMKGLRAHAFLPLDPKSDVDRAFGWVAIDAADDSDLSPEKCFANAPGGEQLRVSLRLDVLKAPASEVKRQLAARVLEMEAVEGRELSRKEKRTLQEEVGRTLRLRAFPRVKILDMVWELEEKRVWFWSQTKAGNELFLDLFAKSFEISIDIDGPAKWAGDSVDPREVARLEPTPELFAGFDGVRPLPTAADGGADGDDDARGPAPASAFDAEEGDENPKKAASRRKKAAAAGRGQDAKPAKPAKRAGARSR